ncbi:MAG: FAD-dependent oxidoreductase [Lachnospiraceae bacterium]|nr:FAD-dependent oxidoreductase [Lachnospiraceae bacterium]
MHDLIIIGAGTAGLSAAVYGARAGKRVLLLEENVYGGQIISAAEVENYPGIRRISGYEFAENLYRQAVELGAELKYEKAVSIQEEGGKKTVVTNRSSYACEAVILATGAKKRRLGLEREEELTGAGVSYCAVCDGAFYRGKDTAVAGGGNTALEDALFLSGYCRKLYLIHRRDRFRGEERLVRALREKDNVTMVMESQIIRLNGKDRLESITVKNRCTGGTGELAVTGLFIAVGQEPDNRAFSEVVRLDRDGYIEAGENCRTDKGGIFAAGDCRTKEVRQLATAAADGAVAALAASAYLK